MKPYKNFQWAILGNLVTPRDKEIGAGEKTVFFSNKKVTQKIKIQQKFSMKNVARKTHAKFQQAKLSSVAPKRNELTWLKKTYFPKKRQKL